MSEQSYDSSAGDSVLIDHVADWLMSQALGQVKVAEIMEGCCNRLVAAGIPLMRAYAAYRTLHPLFQSVSLTWKREGATGSLRQLEHDHGWRFTADQWRNSPLFHMINTGIPFVRRRLSGPGAVVDFPICEDLRDAGATDYIAYNVPYVDEESTADDGLLGSWATDRPQGFTEADLRALGRIQRRLAVSCKVQIKHQISANVLGAYLGQDAGRLVLEGKIARGDGEMMHAVIWYSDLRQSTNLADRLVEAEFLRVLNTYFECTAGAVLAEGGEVLRFVGDAVLAIFPIRSLGVGAACEAALRSSNLAIERMAAANGQRGPKAPELKFGLALHVGPVLFGNIGVPERLEFSVIGPAANEVARLEGLTKTLDCTVLVSGEFARHVDIDWVSKGSHPLRGAGTMEVFAPPRLEAAAPARSAVGGAG